MNRTGNTESAGRKLSTADLAAAARQPDAAREAEERGERERVERDLDARSREDRRLDERVPDAARDGDIDRDARLRDARADDVDSRDLRGHDFRDRAVRAAERAGPDAEGAVMPTPAQTPQKAMPAASSASAASALPAASGANAIPAGNAMPAPAPSEKLDPLFAPEMARDFRARWTAVQSSFVDDPRKAAKQGDELVAQVMTSLAESFAGERDKLEGQLSQTGEASTEILRVSLRRYRSFFERLLSL